MLNIQYKSSDRFINLLSDQWNFPHLSESVSPLHHWDPPRKFGLRPWGGNVSLDSSPTSTPLPTSSSAIGIGVQGGVPLLLYVPKIGNGILLETIVMTYKVSKLNLFTYLNHIPTFEWWVVKYKFEYGQQKDMCLKDI